MTQELIEFTPEGAVVISYNTLVSSPGSLGPAIEKAFGLYPKSLGIIIIRDLPAEYPQYRERLLRLAYEFGQLDELVRESYSDPSSKYSFGWSHGKEIMNGAPDTLKGSYYANPIVEDTVVSPEKKENFPEYYGKNICKRPRKYESGMEHFEEAFKDLSGLIFKVGCELAFACQPFVSPHLVDSTLSLVDLIQNSQTTKARLLHYFPVNSVLPVEEDEPIDSWCGFHVDHSMLTGLCPAMFLRQSESGKADIIDNPSPTSGLYIRTREGQLIKVTIPATCLAFQTGEALEIATGGQLLATPHCVRVGSFSDAGQISRESFALFMQPDTDQHLSEDMTFGAFSKKVFEEHYKSNAM